MKAGKVWGTTELIEANGAMEFHRIEMKKNGVCSKHLHKYKWNGFYVESGKMRVKTWQKDYDLIDETIIGAGQYTKVKPGLYHQFECLEDGIAFEIYWAEFAHNDIVRETTGFMGNEGFTISLNNDTMADMNISKEFDPHDMTLTVTTDRDYEI